MSAVCLKIPIILCLVWMAPVNAGVGGLQWRESGGTVTIQCRSSLKQDSVDLRLGLNEEFQVFHKDGMSGKETIAKEFAERLQTNAEFPNIDILIKNLSQNDTGPYWCVYKKYDSLLYQDVTTKGNGSVLLVVKAKRDREDVQRDCSTSTQDVILVCVVIIGAMLLIIITFFLVWIVHKNRSERTPKKPRRIATNDVYEEMRGTLRH